ncbi:NAD(P)/FAD-dependent oxidoreductase [Bacillus sp. B1-b2]|uniref:NAD(P)/FAD-dependent oxidoreductase n=1 Tax=Bacillus sp. B1-b2 TaxID=2653201 RepID=UPI001262250B|nr:FAD-binding oxidoreductase [Bacillus sp. B1-b2]KAB7666821.1 FAD-binding oxidoreductase [Bacillus sp. B1-b2]
MNLYHGSLYWPTTLKEIETFPTITENETCDVLIIGAGMSGALLTYKLAKEPLKVITVDKGKVGHGSSSANTGLLQYSNDKMLTDFAEEIGEEDAVRFYRLCLEGMNELKEVAYSLSDYIQFKSRKSLYYASVKKDVSSLKKEFDMLKKHHFPAEYLIEEEIYSEYKFKKPAAIRTIGDAEVNPQRFVMTLFKDAHKHNNVHVYEQTEVFESDYKDGYWYFTTANGHTITARKVVYATGYEIKHFTKKNHAELNRTYAIATSPLDNFPNWQEQCLIWETKRPYFYMRTTFDGRIVAGGLDEEKMEAPTDMNMIKTYGERILTRVKEHFHYEDLKVDYVYGATFGESSDGLPFIGEHPEKEGIYYCLGFGGNGTVYSSFGSTIIKDLIMKGSHPDAYLTRIDR